MKTCLIAFLFIATAATSMAAETYTRAGAAPHRAARTARAAQATEVDGVIPRGVRGGNFSKCSIRKRPPSTARRRTPLFTILRQ